MNHDFLQTWFALYYESSAWWAALTKRAYLTELSLLLSPCVHTSWRQSSDFSVKFFYREQGVAWTRSVTMSHASHSAHVPDQSLHNRRDTGASMTPWSLKYNKYNILRPHTVVHRMKNSESVVVNMIRGYYARTVLEWPERQMLRCNLHNATVCTLEL